jgi:predicted RNase H-related nuclease YkuK (DUF458 family)
MEDLYNVGPHKPLGYLPQRTIETLYGESIVGTASRLQATGLKVRVLNQAETQIFSGALYAWDSVAVQKLLDLNRGICVEAQWPLEADAFVEKIWTTTAALDTPIYELIGVLFADHRMTQPTWVKTG